MFDEKEVRRRFAAIHEEYFPDGMQRVGGSWLRARPWYNVGHPFFTFTDLTETEETILERIVGCAPAGLVGRYVAVSTRLLGETDEEVVNLSPLSIPKLEIS